MFSSDITERLPSSPSAWSPRALWQAMLKRRGRPWVVTLACCALSLALLSPTLSTGLVADDLLHQLMLQKDPGIRGLSYRPLDLFRFADGNADTARRLIDEGVFPWWAGPRTVLAFFRPLASLTHYLDHQLWPREPVWMHAHSLLWFGLLLVLVAAVYSQIGSAGASLGLPLLLFSVDDSHAAVVGWVANRNALIALCFALPALYWHDRRRREGFRPGTWLGPAALGLGLFAGETALSVCAYLLAYALFLDAGSWRERAGSLVPYAVVVLIWKLGTAAFGYGSLGSGLYIDPARAPLDFAAIALERLPVLVLGLWALPFADLWEVYPLISPGLRSAVRVAGWLVPCTLGFCARSLWQRSRMFRFWSAGSLLALVPACATFPHDRLLLGASIGAMPVIGEMLELGYSQRQRILPALGMCCLGSIHLVVAPILLPFRAIHLDDFNHLLGTAERSLPTALGGKALILLNPPLDPLVAYLPVYWQAAGRVRPDHLLWLATGVSDLAITTLNDYEIELRPDAGFLSSPSQWMLREPRQGPRLGERIRLDSASVFISELTGDGRPQKVVVTFPRSLNDPDVLWFAWRPSGYVPFDLPAIGRTVVLPAAVLRDVLFDAF